MSDEVNLMEFDESYLELSYKWLSDPALAELVQSGTLNRDEQRRWYNSLSERSDYYAFGVCYKDCPVGVVGLKNVNCDEKTAEYFGYIGSQEQRNKGIGKAMMCLIEIFARKLGIEKLYLHVTRNNLVAISLYLKMGYSIVNEGKSKSVSTLTFHKQL